MSAPIITAGTSGDPRPGPLRGPLAEPARSDALLIGCQFNHNSALKQDGKLGRCAGLTGWLGAE
jgi:hypothetical protein